jgi:hypothetical protein
MRVKRIPIPRRFSRGPADGAGEINDECLVDKAARRRRRNVCATAAV